MEPTPKRITKAEMMGQLRDRRIDFPTGAPVSQLRALLEEATRGAGHPGNTIPSSAEGAEQPTHAEQSPCVEQVTPSPADPEARTVTRKTSSRRPQPFCELM